MLCEESRCLMVSFVSSMSYYGYQSPVMASALAHSSCFFQMLEHPNVSSGASQCLRCVVRRI